MEEKFSNEFHLVTNELATAISNLGGDIGIMCAITSWGDTMDSDGVLAMLKLYNERNKNK